VLDFGLAKALTGDLGRETSAAALANSPTLTSPAMMTDVGVILGTAGYMAPEQAKGKLADKRSDIWALGCVLYEMLAGARAFEGEDVSDTMANVLKREPDWARLPAETPPAVRLLLRRCLRNDKRHRLQDAADVRIEIEDALNAPSDRPSTFSRDSRVALWR
jgi:eukaryotic-like serine/threonine-protein kinase